MMIVIYLTCLIGAAIMLIFSDPPKNSIDLLSNRLFFLAGLFGLIGLLYPLFGG